jgi:hypothetical protein
MVAGVGVSPEVPPKARARVTWRSRLPRPPTGSRTGWGGHLDLDALGAEGVAGGGIGRGDDGDIAAAGEFAQGVVEAHGLGPACEDPAGGVVVGVAEGVVEPAGALDAHAAGAGVEIDDRSGDA